MSNRVQYQDSDEPLEFCHVRQPMQQQTEHQQLNVVDFLSPLDVAVVKSVIDTKKVDKLPHLITM